MEPPLRDEEGDLFGEHVYIATGAQSRVVCVEDDQNADCLIEGVVVERQVNLDVQMSDEPLETSANFLKLDLRVENVEPRGIAGLNANNVRLTQPEVLELKVLAIVRQTGASSLTTGEIDCLDGTMEPGETYTATACVAPATDVNEETYGLNPPSGSDANRDNDGDRLTNLEEYQ